MSDVVVTVPKCYWKEWLDEGGLPGEPDDGREWIFTVPTQPKMQPGERVYVVAHGRLRGYAPLLGFDDWGLYASRVGCGLVRGGGAVAVTIPEKIKGFRGYRYRWWKREDEVPFLDWKTP